MCLLTMKAPFTSSILLVFAITAKATLPVFTIGTNEFSFVFQDSSLSEESMETISEDLFDLVTTAWTNTTVVFSGSTEGNVLFASLGNPPFSRLRPLPSHFESVDTNGVFLLSVETSLSNDYLAMIQTLNLYTQQVESAHQFVNFLRSNAFSGMPPEDVSKYFYMEGLDEAGYRASRNAWIGEAAGVTFFEPSILSFDVVQGMIDGVDESFTMQIPIQRAFSSRIRNSSVPAVWMDGRWKVYVIQW